MACTKMKAAALPERMLQRLDWTVIRRLDGLLQGNYRTLFRGFGLELAELREYQPGDDVRSIDWYVTARMAAPYTRLHVEDREVTAWFLLDVSPSVDFGTARARKRDLLVELTGVLARLLTRHGNRVGAVLFNGAAPRVVPAGGGKLHVLRLINDLLAEPRLARAPVTRLSTLFEAAGRVIRRRSLVFAVSDFISLPGWDKTLAALCARHEVLAIRLKDPRESELPDIGTVILEDSESGEQLFLDTHDAGFRRRFRETAWLRERGLRGIFARCGVDVLELSTEGDLVMELARFARLRARRRPAPAAGCG
jgi:uncharacterized protein (DUF58 family)